MTDAGRLCVGVDVAKATLDVQVRPTDAHWGVANEDGGIRTLVERMRELVPAQIVIEATGGYEAGLPAVVDPVRDGDRLTFKTVADVGPTGVG